MKKSKIKYYLCFFFFALFYVIHLFSQNISEVELYVIIRPILILFILSTILFEIFRLVSKNRNKATFLSLISLVLILVYGILYSYLLTHPVFGQNLGRHSFLGAVWILFFGLIIYLLALKKFRVSNQVIFTMNLVTAILLVITIANTAIKKVNFDSVSSINKVASSTIESQEKWLAEVKQPITVKNDQILPDIYYIIPDMFAREDAILEVTDYDNCAFIEQLRQLGFFVADCSRSNYASTQLSIASSLNMNYLPDIQDGMTDRPMLVTPTSNSLVRKSLEEIGYQTIVFDNGFGLSEIRNATFNIKFKDKFFLFVPNTPFENLIVSNSILRIFYDVNLGLFSTLYDRVFFPYWDHVNTQKKIFDQLPDIIDYSSPKFVFVHIMMPHPPFLIREDGSIETNSDYYRESLGQPINDDLYRNGYLMQVKYVENRLIETVRQIIAQSNTEPIIIIQGDHGISGDTRLSILNAYYLPQEGFQNLYSTITPVNSFRVIFNSEFGTHYDLLPDVSRFSVYPDWFEMSIDSEKNPVCQESQ